jgi:hypothetical protein
VFEKRVLGRIFRPKRYEVIGCWRKLHNEELHNLYSSPSIIRMIKSRRISRGWHEARMGEKRNACRILIGKPFTAHENYWNSFHLETESTPKAIVHLERLGQLKNPMAS